MPKTIAIVQARMGSKRLPGKIMMELGWKPLVEYTLSALKQCHRIDKIYLATGSGAENKSLLPICQKLGVNLYFGPEDNVLQRYWEVLEQERNEGRTYDYIVRICADSPFIDAPEVDRLISAHQEKKADLSINYNHPTGLPCGFGVEVISYDALKESVELAQTDEHREHLDEWILQHPQKYKIYQHSVPKEKQCYRIHFTIDTPEDFAFMQALVKEAMKEKEYSFTPTDLLRIVRRDPMLLALRKMKLFVRADGNGEIGMGHIVRSLTVCRALKERLPKLDVMYYTTPEAVNMIQENGFAAKLFDKSSFRQEVINQNPGIIIIDLRKHLDDISSEHHNWALKVRFIDSEMVQAIRADVVINSFPLAPFSSTAAYYAGFQYFPLRQEFSQLPPKVFSPEVQKITISLGGGDQLGEEEPGSLILQLLSVLKEFPQHVTLVLGSAMSKEAVEKIKSFVSQCQNIKTFQNVSDIHILFHETDLGISAGGNTLLEFARCEVPTICISLDYDTTHPDHQQYYCKAVEKVGASVYLGHANQWSKEKFRELLQDLIDNPSKRKEMAAKGRVLVDDNALEKISRIIMRELVQG